MKATHNLIEILAAKSGNKKWGTDIQSIIEKLKEEVEELEAATTDEEFIDELADLQLLITRLTIIREQSCNRLLGRAMEKHYIRETNPNYKKSKK